MDARFRNDETGASAYDPRGMLKIVLLGYSRGLISSRRIEAARLHNVRFIALTQWRLYCLVHNIEKLAGCAG
ncbi:MAG: transposase [Acidovorax sp.]